MNGESSEPTQLEIELTIPTALAYSTIRLRTSASRKEGESMFTLADRLTELLVGIAREQSKHVEEGLRDVVRRK